MTETEIIQKCKQYDKTAFKELVRCYSPVLMSICLRYMGDRHFGEDMLQESFIRIFNNILQYQDKGSFKSWLCRIAVTTCLKEIRKQNWVIDGDIDEYEEVVGTQMDITDESGVMKIIEDLPDCYRIVFNLYVIEGYSHLEISEMLGIKESTSRTQLTRARKMIQASIIKINGQVIM